MTNRMGLLSVCLVILIAVVGSSCQRYREAPEQTEDRTSQVRVTEDRPYDYQTMQSDIEEVREKMPDLVSVDRIGMSHQSRELTSLRVGSGDRSILVVGAHHGREWITSLLLMKLAVNLAQWADQRQEIAGMSSHDILNSVTIYFVPMLNPDGVDIAINGLANQPKEHHDFLLQANKGDSDFSQWKANARGVNLNIQYEANWDEAETVTAPHAHKYKGDRPLSEPESRALAQFTKQIDPAAAVAYHASGGVIYWRYGQTGDNLQRDLRLAELLREHTGYQLAREEAAAVHAGFKDWVISELKRPGYTIEVGPPTEGQPLPLSTFPDLWEENKTAILGLARAVVDARD